MMKKDRELKKMDRYLKVKDVQEILSCSKTKVYAIINQKSFPKIKIGKQFYIPFEAFKKWENTYLYKEFRLSKKCH